MLADATRIQMLWSLADREGPSTSSLSISESRAVGLAAPGQVANGQIGPNPSRWQTIFYSLENEHVRQLVIDAVFNAEHAGPGDPRHHRADERLQVVADTSDNRHRPESRP